MDGTRSLLRERAGHGHGKIAFIELFFDLVFVFAITQLSRLLIEHLSLLGAIETLLLMLAVWWVWIHTASVTDRLDPERIPVRLLLFVLMIAGLILSSSIPKAFESTGPAFAGAYVFMQAGRTLFMLWALRRGNPELTRNFQRILAWLLLSAVFWIAGGFAEGGVRFVFWAAALGIDYLSPAVGFWVPLLGSYTAGGRTEEGGRLAERCGLFIVIALGGSILVTGGTFSALSWTPATVAAFVASVVGSIAMWWLYFDVSAQTANASIAASDDPGRLALPVHTYVHVFLVAGIILCAVSDEFILANPGAHLGPRVVLTMLGGTALYLLGILLFKQAITRKMPVSPLIGIVALIALGVFAEKMTALTLAISTALVLVGVAIRERARPPEMRPVTR